MSTLKFGSRGDEVKQLQTLLGVEADGIFGKLTLAAVLGFQRKMSLVADGIVGVKTWKALGVSNDCEIECEDLKQYSSPHGTMVYGGTGYSTYKAGGCGVTAFAIVQRAYGLAPEGEAATETIQRLGKYAYEHGYRIKGAGTAAGLFGTNGTGYTATVKAAAIENALVAGKLVIMCIKKGFGNGYTGAGHYVVAYGIKDGYVLLRDVGSSAAGRQRARLDKITEGLKSAYVIERSGG